MKDKLVIDCINCNPDLTDAIKEHQDKCDIIIRHLKKEDNNKRDPAFVSLSGKTIHTVIKEAVK